MKLPATDVLARRMGGGGEVRVKGMFDVAPVNVREVAGSVSDFLACLWGAKGTFITAQQTREDGHGYRQW
jgi:hypothetical protein